MDDEDSWIAAARIVGQLGAFAPIWVDDRLSAARRDGAEIEADRLVRIARCVARIALPADSLIAPRQAALECR